MSSFAAFFLFYTLITTFIRDWTDRELIDNVNRFSTLLARDGIKALENGMILESQAAGVKKVFFRLLHKNGDVYSSTNVSHWRGIGINSTSIGHLLKSNGLAYETIVFPGRKDKVRILYALLSPDVIVQIGYTMESYSLFLDAFKDIFITTMAILILTAAGMGWFMAKRAVAGIGAVTKTAMKISGGALHERVAVKREGHEIDQLAATFNQMLDRIEALLTELKEMSDNIAHDLKSPITRIRGAAEVALSTGASTIEYEAMAAGAIEECDRLLDMINTMLLISKTESGVYKLTREVVDLGALTGKACELFEPAAHDKDVNIICHAPDSCLIEADKQMLQRMIANLLDNAIKFTPSGGTVEVIVRENERQEFVVSVRDTGTGISDIDLPRIFDRFYHCDQSRSQLGTGLGLSLARAVARAHGGDITVASTPGCGSTFDVIIPKKSPA